jgi:hypothetical protein
MGDEICQRCGEWPCACWWVCDECGNEGAECCCVDVEDEE